KVRTHRAGPCLTPGWQKFLIEPKLDAEFPAEPLDRASNHPLSPFAQVEAQAVVTSIQERPEIDPCPGQSCHDVNELEIDPVLVECRNVPLTGLVDLVAARPYQASRHFDLEIKPEHSPVPFGTLEHHVIRRKARQGRDARKIGQPEVLVKAAEHFANFTRSSNVVPRGVSQSFPNLLNEPPPLQQRKTDETVGLRVQRLLGADHLKLCGKRVRDDARPAAAPHSRSRACQLPYHS